MTTDLLRIAQSLPGVANSRNFQPRVILTRRTRKWHQLLCIFSRWPAEEAPIEENSKHRISEKNRFSKNWIPRCIQHTLKRTWAVFGVCNTSYKSESHNKVKKETFLELLVCLREEVWKYELNGIGSTKTSIFQPLTWFESAGPHLGWG